MFFRVTPCIQRKPYVSEEHVTFIFRVEELLATPLKMKAICWAVSTTRRYNPETMFFIVIVMRT
jgi:hypothetical protein